MEDGPLLRSISKGGRGGESLSDWAIWAVISASARAIGIERIGAHDLAAPRKALPQGGRRSRTDQVLLGHSSIQTTERYLGSEQEIAVAARAVMSGLARSALDARMVGKGLLDLVNAAVPKLVP